MFETSDSDPSSSPGDQRHPYLLTAVRYRCRQRPPTFTSILWQTSKLPQLKCPLC